MTHPLAAAEYVVVDTRTGLVLRSGSVPFRDMAAQAKLPHEIVLEGPVERRTMLDLDALQQGEIRFIPRPPKQRR